MVAAQFQRLRRSRELRRRQYPKIKDSWIQFLDLSSSVWIAAIRSSSRSVDVTPDPLQHTVTAYRFILIVWPCGPCFIKHDPARAQGRGLSHRTHARRQVLRPTASSAYFDARSRLTVEWMSWFNAAITCREFRDSLWSKRLEDRNTRSLAKQDLSGLLQWNSLYPQKIVQKAKLASFYLYIDRHNHSHRIQCDLTFLTYPISDRAGS
jgi:hypothetical protein